MNLEKLGKYCILFSPGKNVPCKLFRLPVLGQESELGFSYSSITDPTRVLIKSSVISICYSDFFQGDSENETVRYWS